MEIEEVKERANKLKARISALLLDFEKETGATITNINRTGYTSLGPNPTMNYVEFEVRLW